MTLLFKIRGKILGSIENGKLKEKEGNLRIKVKDYKTKVKTLD
jgi:hypothetical protein